MPQSDLARSAAEGLADAMRRSPIVYAVVLEALAIAVLAWSLIADSRTERQTNSAYIQKLHAQLIECHSRRNITTR